MSPQEQAMSVGEESAHAHIRTILNRILTRKGRTIPAIEPTTVLLGRDLGIDSLDLAMLVRELERALGFDPFRQGFIEFRTVGELARLYAR